MSVIETRGLTKRYRRTLAVADLDLRVESGEIYGFLGVNGAGKSTAIRMLLGMTRPTSGEARLFGRSRPEWRKVGHLVDGAHCYPDLTTRENVLLAARLRGVRDRRAVDAILGLVGLERYSSRRAGELSLGSAQRLGLAKALVHRPDLLVLDEPGNGLDPAGIVWLRALLVDLATEGVTVLVSSHILAEVARVATRVGMIHQGRLLTELDTAALPHCTCGGRNLEDVFLGMLTEHEQRARP